MIIGYLDPWGYTIRTAESPWHLVVLHKSGEGVGRILQGWNLRRLI